MSVYSAAIQQNSPIFLLLLGKYNSRVLRPSIRPTAVSYDEIVLWKEHTLVCSARESSGRTLRVRVNSHPSSKCITLHSAVAFTKSLCITCFFFFITAPCSYLINFHWRRTLTMLTCDFGDEYANTGPESNLLSVYAHNNGDQQWGFLSAAQLLVFNNSPIIRYTEGV